MKTKSLKNNGKTFEAMVALHAQGYETQGVASLEKVEPPTRMICRGKGQWVPILTANPFLDFLGTWTAKGGRALFIECKETAAGRLPVCRDGGLTVAQYTALERWHKAGACVAVLWSHAGEIRLVSLNALRAVRAEERASMDWASAYKIPPGLGFVTHDFLATLAAVYDIRD